MRVRERACVCVRVFVCMRVCACTCANTYLCVFMFACMHVCMHVCMYACMHVCMYACVDTPAQHPNHNGLETITESDTTTVRCGVGRDRPKNVREAYEERPGGARDMSETKGVHSVLQGRLWPHRVLTLTKWRSFAGLSVSRSELSTYKNGNDVSAHVR